MKAILGFIGGCFFSLAVGFYWYIPKAERAQWEKGYETCESCAGRKIACSVGHGDGPRVMCFDAARCYKEGGVIRQPYYRCFNYGE